MESLQVGSGASRPGSLGCRQHFLAVDFRQVIQLLSLEGTKSDIITYIKY